MDHFDELNTIGLVLAKSATILPEFKTQSGPRNCIDVAALKAMQGACSIADREALEECVQMFLTKRSVLRSTPPRQDAKHARVLKLPTDIARDWQLIMDK